MPVPGDSDTHCIYCDQDAAGGADQHILPKGLAGDTLVLRDMVCTDCNRYFGTSMEQAIWNGLFGLQMQFFGIRNREGRVPQTVGKGFTVKREGSEVRVDLRGPEPWDSPERDVVVRVLEADTKNVDGSHEVNFEIQRKVRCPPHYISSWLSKTFVEYAAWCQGVPAARQLRSHTENARYPQRRTFLPFWWAWEDDPRVSLKLERDTAGVILGLSLAVFQYRFAVVEGEASDGMLFLAGKERV